MLGAREGQETNRAACVLGRRDERRVWELVVFHPLRGEVTRHGLATRVAYDEAKAERGLAAANGALKSALEVNRAGVEHVRRIQGEGGVALSSGHAHR